MTEVGGNEDQRIVMERQEDYTNHLVGSGTTTLRANGGERSEMLQMMDLLRKDRQWREVEDQSKRKKKGNGGKSKIDDGGRKRKLGDRLNVSSSLCRCEFNWT